MSERPFKSLGEFNKWLKEQDALPITKSGKLVELEPELAGWLGRDGSFTRKADDLLRLPPTLFSPPADPLQEWKAKHDYAAADLQQTLAHFENLKDVALDKPGTAGRRWDWRPSYGVDCGVDHESGLLQLVEAIKRKRAAFEAIDGDPPLVIAQQRLNNPN